MPTPPPVSATVSPFVDTAASIGRLLCRDALWHGPRCTFLTSTSDPAFSYPRPYFKALDADFYAGSAGVAFFLAALYDATHDRLVRQTALGTLRHALSTARRIPATAALGFFSGWTGVAFAAIQGGHWLHDEELTEEGYQLLTEVFTLDPVHWGLDVIDGAAGAIPALIRLERDRPSADQRAFIIRLADSLVSRAEPSAEGYSWNTLPGTGTRNLTGLAHGTSGIANALLDVYALTGTDVYRTTAFRGIAYERAFFDVAQQNWPDFRVESPVQPAPNATTNGPVCSCAWCHGAPGITLARLHGYEQTQDPALRAEAEAGLTTTARQLNWQQQPNFSLCHGLAGNADVLLEAANVLNQPARKQQATDLGRFGQEQYQRTDVWANGLYNDYQLPDFMLGLSGIGYFYLRLTDPARYRSVLLLR